MTEFDLQKVLIEHFETLNTFSGIQFLKNNVAYPNKSFTVPVNKTWFELKFLNNEPDVVGMTSDGQNRYTNIMQIDICTPLGKGEAEAENKYKWISKLFSRGTTIGDIMIDTVYLANKVAETDHYRSNVRIVYEADVDKE